MHNFPAHERNLLIALLVAILMMSAYNGAIKLQDNVVMHQMNSASYAQGVD